MVGNFPDGNSALMLVASRLRYIAGRQWGRKRYMNMDLLYGGASGYQIMAAFGNDQDGGRLGNVRKIVDTTIIFNPLGGYQYEIPL